MRPSSSSSRSRRPGLLVPPQVRAQRRVERRVDRTLLRLARLIFLLAISVLCVAGIAYGLGVRVNLSGSIPPGLYRTTSAPIRRGSVVLACLPGPTARFARQRGFVPPGACPGGAAPVGKTIGAVSGDTVDVSPNGISVNGKPLPNTRALVVDSDKRPLDHIQRGRYVVADNQVWLISTFSARSFDSRYFGPISTASLIAHVFPLFTAD